MSLVDSIMGGEFDWLLGKPEGDLRNMPDLTKERLKVLEKEYLAVKEERDALKSALEIFADKKNWGSHQIVGLSEWAKYSVWKYQHELTDMRHPAEIAQESLSHSKPDAGRSRSHDRE